MQVFFRRLVVTFLLLASWAEAEHVIIAGGPSLRRWEDLRVPEDQHDRWWANFIRASTLRIDELRKAYGPNAKIVWIVHQRSYQTRGREDGKPYTTWIAEQAAKRNTSLVWVNTSGDLLRAINARPRGSVQTFDFFGHSNRHAFLLEYSNDIIGVSSCWLHERDLPRIKSSIFAPNAYCKSWGCHTGESMSQVWRRTLGTSLEGARGKTLYTVVGQGRMPVVEGSWVR